MIAFEVSLNGEKVCVAGVGELGVLSGHVCWVRREGEEIDLETELTLGVGGLLTPSNEDMRWPPRNLAVNDVVQFKIVNADIVDAPPIKGVVPSFSEEAEKQYVREMASKFGWTINENNT